MSTLIISMSHCEDCNCNMENQVLYHQEWRLTQTRLYNANWMKRGMVKLNFVCESARNSAPSWWIDASFCMVGTNVIYFSETKFFELTLFGQHEVKLHHLMFLSPEILSFHVSYIWVTKIDVSGLKNIVVDKAWWAKHVLNNFFSKCTIKGLIQSFSSTC